METERDTEKQRLITAGENRKTGRMMCREKKKVWGKEKRWQQTHGKKEKGRFGWVIHWCAHCSGRWSEGSRDREKGGIERKDRERNGKAVERGRGGDRHRQVL